MIIFLPTLVVSDPFPPASWTESNVSQGNSSQSTRNTNQENPKRSPWSDRLDPPWYFLPPAAAPVTSCSPWICTQDIFRLHTNAACVEFGSVDGCLDKMPKKPPLVTRNHGANDEQAIRKSSPHVEFDLEDCASTRAPAKSQTCLEDLKRRRSCGPFSQIFASRFW